MPVIKSASDAAFAKNIAETRINSKTGEERPLKQRLAIAYRARREAMKKKK